MKHSKKLLWMVSILVLVTLAGGIYYILSELGIKKSSVTDEYNMFHYQAGGLEVGLATNPSTPRVGDNQLIIEVRELNGKLMSAVINAYAEMPAMGAMPAMRAPIDLKEIVSGRYQGTVNLSMRGEWPLTITIQGPQGQQPVRLQFDLATDRPEIPIAVGGVQINASAQASTDVSGNGMPSYRAGDLEIAINIDPRTARVGQNKIMIEVHNAGGKPVPSIEVEAFAQMPAMGTMPAMRAPADLKQMSPVRYEGSMNLSMRGEWPLTVVIKDPQHSDKRLQFDLATDREGLAIVAGATPADGTVRPTDDASVITIDNRRRQMIGVETDEVIHRDLVKSIRAVGEVMFDERLLSQVTLKFDGYVGDLKANYVGAKVNKNQILFTVYSPDLLAAQQEYLTTLKRRQNRDTEDGLLRAARQRLALWDMSPQEIKKLEQRGSPQDYIAIYAPRSGTLIERNIVDGSAAHKGQTLLTIADLSRVWIETEVFEADLELVQVGMMANFTLPYLPGRTYPAVVEYIYPYLESDSRTGRIRLSFNNPDGVLKPDMYAEVLLEAKLGRRLSIPEEAIIVAGGSRVVFTDLGQGRLKPIRIKTGRNAQGFVEVLDGLSAGDIVVTSGNFLIAAETRLKTGIEQW